MDEPAPDEPTGAPDRFVRRRRTLAIAGALLALVGLTAVVLTRGDDGPPPPADLPLDAWAPYWALDVAEPELAGRAPLLRELSPFWFQVTGVDAIGPDPNASGDLTAAMLATARAAGVAVVPSLSDATDAGIMASILADPASRADHVAAIVRFVDSGGFDGVDLNYERFAFADGRDTWAQTRPSWVAFIAELDAALGARRLVVSIPPVYDDGRSDASGYWVYDYGAIAPHVDRIRVMAYDYSFDEPGPIAPIGWVERVIDGATEAAGGPEKLVLGLPAYGYNWPVATVGTCPVGQAPGRTTVTPRSVDDLVARREAVPVPDDAGGWTFTYELTVDDGTTSCVQTREVHYVAADGVRARLDLARRARWDGAVLWALGYEDAEVWAAIDDLVRRG